MTQGYRRPFARSRRLDMNWLNFLMPLSAVTPCAQPPRGHGRPRAAPVSRHPSTHVPICADRVPKRAAQANPKQPKVGHGPESPERPSPAHPCPHLHRQCPEKGGPSAPQATESGTRRARTHPRPTTRDAPAPSTGYGGVERMPWTQSRSRSRRCGRSLRLAERPPWSRRRSMSWPEMRVSARRSIVSFDRSTGSSTSEKS